LDKIIENRKSGVPNSLFLFLKVKPLYNHEKKFSIVCHHLPLSFAVNFCADAAGDKTGAQVRPGYFIYGSEHKGLQ